MRGYQAIPRFLYGHDHDLASWIVKDIVIDRHLRLIGQQTSTLGIFVGPFHYYALIPFYWLTHMDPIGSLAYPFLIGLLAIISVYYTFTKLFNRQVALIGSLLYSVSYLISQNERDIVPTTSVSLWTIWFFYGVNLVLQGNPKGLLLLAVLIALIWHVHLALVLLLPLIPLALWMSKHKFTLRDFVFPVLVLLFLSLPLLVFETRHNFSQTRTLVSSLISSSQGSPVSKLHKFDRVFFLTSNNAKDLFLKNVPYLPSSLVTVFLVLTSVYLLKSKRISPQIFILVSLWNSLYLVFFTFHPILVSEYYLNGMNVMWLVILTSFISGLNLRLAFLLLIAVSLYNIKLFLPYRQSTGYVQRKALVEYIRLDSVKHNYPCIAISYMTNPGYELGYRYLFWLVRLHVNHPNSLSPVYTIVFPLSLAGRVDAVFGGLGLVLPKYQIYSPQGVKLSCSGEDSNLTDSMFGFTK